MKLFIVVSVVLATATAKPSNIHTLSYIAAPVAVGPAVAFAAGPISSQYHAQDVLGQYSYGYANGLSAKTEVKSVDGITRGGYTYVDAEGKLQSVQYSSDAQNGFRVAASNLPVAPAMPVAPVLPQPLPVKDTPEVAEAKAKHLAALEEAKVRATIVEAAPAVVSVTAGPIVAPAQLLASAPVVAPAPVLATRLAAAPVAASVHTSETIISHPTPVKAVETVVAEPAPVVATRFAAAPVSVQTSETVITHPASVNTVETVAAPVAVKTAEAAVAAPAAVKTTETVVSSPASHTVITGPSSVSIKSALPVVPSLLATPHFHTIGSPFAFNTISAPLIKSVSVNSVATPTVVVSSAPSAVVSSAPAVAVKSAVAPAQTLISTPAISGYSYGINSLYGVNPFVGLNSAVISQPAISTYSAQWPLPAGRVVVGPNVPVDTPEVAKAKAEHLAAFEQVKARSV